MGDYQVICSHCGHAQDPYSLRCPYDDSLLRAVYSNKRFEVRPFPGIWRFIDWLPVSGMLKEAHSGPVTYKSEGLARELGLEGLYISFNGYWPEKGADMLTGSFKELEALPTLERLRERGKPDVLVVASAGNTGRAFAYVASLTGWPVVVVVPSCAQDRIWLPDAERGRVMVVAVDGDYYDAIALGDLLACCPGFVPEGGARNVARRDGMGTVMLDAVRSTGSLPRHYFQAVGSGTGGISAFEASLRLMADGRFGRTPPVLHLAQSLPCAPLLHARTGGSYPGSCPQGIFDDVLFNRRPPYEVPGGVREALELTGGEVIGVTNDEAAAAKSLFEEVEGIDILPASGVGVAALVRSVRSGDIGPGEACLLNITGGGVARAREDHDIKVLGKNLTVRPGQDMRELSERIKEELEVR